MAGETYPRAAGDVPTHVTPAPLACSVRDCHEPLQRAGRAWVCASGHSYDIARSGYVNLLQPQDRRSPDAGDSREAVEARATLLAQGAGRAAIEAVVSQAQALGIAGTAVVLELGSGSGETLARLAEVMPVQGVGLDLSAAAAAFAARRYPGQTWIVANADRRLPLLDHSVHLVVSVHARRNPSECQRVLVPGGYLIVAVPAADDLIELREAVQGEGVPRERVSGVVAEHGACFEEVTRSEARQQLTLGRDSLLQLLRGTYRGVRQSESRRVDALDRLTVTLASDVVLLRARPASPSS